MNFKLSGSMCLFNLPDLSKAQPDVYNQVTYPLLGHAYRSKRPRQLLRKKEKETRKALINHR